MALKDKAMFKEFLGSDMSVKAQKQENVVVEKTITRADLCEAVYNKVGLSRTESARLVETVLEEILLAVERGENVKLSSFGSFLLRDKDERIGRNPKTGEEAKITARRVMTFKPAVQLKAMVSGKAPVKLKK